MLGYGAGAQKRAGKRSRTEVADRVVSIAAPPGLEDVDDDAMLSTLRRPRAFQNVLASLRDLLQGQANAAVASAEP